MKKMTVTIGIPAYNEANNIAALLSELTHQKTKRVRIGRINVISDGSVDATVSQARKVKDHKVQVVGYKKTAGPAIRQDQLIGMTHTDILVLLNADIAISDPYFVEKLVTPIVRKQAQMTSAAIAELPPRTFFESVLGVSMQLKEILFSEFKRGNNLYNCHGAARAFHKDLYQKLHFKMNEGEDMYSYMACIKNKLKFVYAPRAIMYYRLPATFVDHNKQSLRYLHAQNVLGLQTDSASAKAELTIPTPIILRAGIKSVRIIMSRPLHVLVYLGVLLVIKLRALARFYPNQTW